MDTYENIHKIGPWTELFRVICVGKDMSGVFRSIMSFGFEGVSVQSTDMFPNPTPTDVDKMVILLANEDRQQLESIAKSFYQAGVLTLIINTSEHHDNHVQCDSLTISYIDDMPKVVRAILIPILSDSYINFDFSNISSIFKDSHLFKVYESYGCGMGNRIENAIDCMPVALSEDMKNCERALIYISCPMMQLGFITKQWKSVNAFIQRFPLETDVMALPINDENSPTDRIRLSIILSGKELEL
jgi:hypothetical protein